MERREIPPSHNRYNKAGISILLLCAEKSTKSMQLVHTFLRQREADPCPGKFDVGCSSCDYNHGLNVDVHILPFEHKKDAWLHFTVPYASMLLF